jgi:hypothetical protein
VTASGGLASRGGANSVAGQSDVEGGAAGHTAGDAPIPSAGCGRHGPEGPMRDGTVRYILPTSYDGVTPLPLLFVLHATNLFTDVNKLASDERAAHYVLAGPQALERGTFEDGRNIEPYLTQVLSEVCVDQNEVFGAGNGSGGRVLMTWIGKRDKLGLAAPRFRAAAIVGTFYGNYGPVDPPLPLIFIHSTQSNNSRSLANDEDGTKAAAKLRALNACGESTSPVDAVGCTVASMPVSPGCVDYQGCSAPLRFCHHDDLSGQSGGDPWTCMATPAILDFFEPFASVE